MAARLIVSLGLFAGSLALGWWLARRGRLSDEGARRLIEALVKRLSPVVLALSCWALELRDPQPLLLPASGLIVTVAALLPAGLYARSARLTRAQQGSFLTCAMFSNGGFLGAMIAFALFGEAGYGLAMLYMLHFNPCFYAIGFGIARRFGRVPSAPAPAARRVWIDPLRWYPFLGLCAGLLLSLLRAPRPAAVSVITQLLIPIEMALYLVAIGSQLRSERAPDWWRPSLAMAGIKFLYNPLIGWLLAGLLGLSGAARSVVLLQAAMPVATAPLMLPALFGLDRRLATTLWFATTLAAIPMLLVYASLLLQ